MATKKIKLVSKDKSENDDFNVMQKTQELAFSYYLERLQNNQPGDDMSDWAAAESQIRGKKSA